MECKCNYCGKGWGCEEHGSGGSNQGCDCRRQRNNHCVRVHDLLPDGATAHENTDDRVQGGEPIK